MKLVKIAVCVLLAVTGFAQEHPTRPRVLGIAHVALSVSDLPQARAFYTDFLGFAEPFSLKRPDGSDWITYIKINDQQYLELFLGNSQSHGAFQHFALYTDDVNAMQEYLTSRHVPLAEAVRITRTGDALLSLRDPAGNLIEIVQYQSGSWSNGAQGKFLPPARISDQIADIGIVVRSAAPVIRFYRDILGFQPVVLPAGARGQTYSFVLRVPNGSDAIHFLNSQKRLANHKDLPSDYVGLLSRDVDATWAILQSRVRKYNGLNLVPLKDPSGASVSDTNGNQFKIVSPAMVKSLETQ